MSDGFSGGINDIGNLPGVIIDATENIVQGVGNTAAELPAFGQSIINVINAIPRVMEAASYIGLIMATATGLYLIRNPPKISFGL